MMHFIDSIRHVIEVLWGLRPIFDRDEDEYVRELRSRFDDSEEAVKRMQMNDIEQHLLWGDRHDTSR